MTERETIMTREEALDIARDYLEEKLKPEKSDGAKEDYDQFYKSGNNVNFSNGIYKGCKIHESRFDKKLKTPW